MSLPAKKRASSPTVHITQKDIGWLDLIYSYRIVSIKHLIDHFAPAYKTADEKKAWSIWSAFYRRIQQLARADVVRLRRVPALSGKGSGPYLITLGPAGVRELADYLRVPRSELSTQASGVDSAYGGAHALALASVRTAIDLACRHREDVRLMEWIDETALRHPRQRVTVQDPITQETKALIPDGTFTLQLQNGSAQGFRLEVDLTGSTAARRQRQKLRLYLAHLSIDRRPVLWVTPNPATAHLIAERCQSEAKALGANQTLFWITIRDQVREDTVLTPIWSVVGGPTISLVPPSAPPAAPPPASQGGSSWNG
jgi:hypothetical protein